MKAILALDQGTTSSRAIIFDHQGQALAMAQLELQPQFPQPGWVEQDPQEIWRTQLVTAHEALKKAGVAISDIAGIGLTNQRETTLVWNKKSGIPIYNAIVWQDRRTAEFCAALTSAGHADLVADKTGLIIDPYFSASKLRWILDHVPGARELAKRGELAFGTVDSWLIWKLTGGAVHATDSSNASRTMLYNIHSHQWDHDLLALMDIPGRNGLLPDVRSSSEIFGSATPDLFGREIPIAGVAGDQQAALFGQTCFAAGCAKNTYGTGCFMLMNIADQPIKSRHRLLTTIAWQFNGKTQYALEGSVFIAGAVVQWLRDSLGLIQSSGQIEQLAGSVPDSGGVYFVPAFAGLGSPYWDAYARGALLGLTRGTTAAHIARAALESIAHQSADLLDAMRQDSGRGITELRVDGGAASNNLLMQFQADLLGVKVLRPQVTQTTALGAAYLAGLAVGFWDNPADVARHWAVDRVFEPKMSGDEVQSRRARWKKAVARACDWEEHE
jgi:glycerol kinase